MCVPVFCVIINIPALNIWGQAKQSMVIPLWGLWDKSGGNIGWNERLAQRRTL